jgi:AcrR family transcriptional regulator
VRLSRAESRQRTRAAVVEAATTLFLREGFGVTSLEQVADRAGFTIGAVYSNFDGKAALGNAVIDELYTRAERRLAALEHEPGSEAWFAALAEWADDTIGDPQWMRLEIEVAASDPAHRAAAAARYAQMRDRCAELIARLPGRPAGVDIDLIATAVVGLALGIGAQRATDPEISASTFSEVLRAFAGRRSAAESGPLASNFDHP